MIVVVDGATASSGESSALMLKAVFGATIIGTPSYGMIDYGNAAPYFLPHSGLQIYIPSKTNDWGYPIDFAGIQPEVRLDPQTPSNEIALRFEELDRSVS